MQALSRNVIQVLAERRKRQCDLQNGRTAFAFILPAQRVMGIGRQFFELFQLFAPYIISRHEEILRREIWQNNVVYQFPVGIINTPTT